MDKCMMSKWEVVPGAPDIINIPCPYTTQNYSPVGCRHKLKQ